MPATLEPRRSLRLRAAFPAFLAPSSAEKAVSRLRMLFICVLGAGVILSGHAGGIGGTAAIPDEEFAFKLCMMERSGMFNTDQITLARWIAAERNDRIELFSRHGLLSDEALAGKRQAITEVALQRLSALVTGTNREDWDAWSRQEFDISRHLPLAPRSVGRATRASNP